MKKLVSLVLVSAFVAIAGCEHDDTDDCYGCDDIPPAYENLTQRDHVLNNLELAYNNRRIDKYGQILDADFIMYFSAGDVGAGTPEQWGRQDELDANRNLFNPAYDDPDGLQPRCLKISLDVKWEDGLNWQGFEPSRAPGETWYSTTVFYNFQFDIEPDLHLINNPASKAQFTVRNAGTNEAPHWQLVEMRDFDADVLSNSSTSATERTTLGKVKAMYR